MIPSKGEEEYLYDDKALEKYRKTHTGSFTLQRYKGLGEMDAQQLWETTLNPEKRSLVQLTFGDIERDIEIFNKLKSDKPKYQAQRKAMFEGYRIRRDDLDN